MRKLFSDLVKAEIKQNPKTVCLLGDISVGLFIDETESLFNNCYNVGILEQATISLAAGLSSQGYQPIVHTISPFIIERAYEQIKLELGYNKNKVILVSANGPYEYNLLGPTHHCPSDVVLLNQLENFNIFLPGRLKDYSEAFKESINSKNSSYIRVTNKVTEVEFDELIEPFVYSKFSNNDEIKIFVGESLVQYDDSQKFDCLYLSKLTNEMSLDLEKYKKIKVYEPYSYPLLGNHLMGKYHRRVESYFYPKNIETGIFEQINYEKNRNVK